MGEMHVRRDETHAGARVVTNWQKMINTGEDHPGQRTNDCLQVAHTMERAASFTCIGLSKRAGGRAGIKMGGPWPGFSPAWLYSSHRGGCASGQPWHPGRGQCTMPQEDAGTHVSHSGRN